MPRIQGISCADNLLTIALPGGISHVLTAAMVPGANNTIALVEAWINTVWLPSVIPATLAKMAVHVTSIAPLQYVAIAVDADKTIPANWWVNK
jgi:hypothetical protein